MELFQEQVDSTKNWLPYDGTVHYWGKIFSQKQSDAYYKSLMEQIAWKNDEAIIFGKHIITKRKVAWYADKPYEYTYSKISRTALLWTPLLLELKEIVQKKHNKNIIQFY